MRVPENVPGPDDRVLRADAPAALIRDYRHTRAASMDLVVHLSAEDCCVQSMPDASPVKWHLAHTTWFFETFVLERFEAGFRPFHPANRVLFNSYYNAIGAMHPRPERGLVTRPALDEVMAYRNAVDGRMLALLGQTGNDPALADIVRLGIQHEQQHQELILTDLKHLLSRNPLLPAYQASAPLPPAAPQPLTWLTHPGGFTEIGHAGKGFCFDNEQPAHRVWLQPFELASRPVTNAEYLAFVEQGGYDDPSHWLSDGWHWVRERAVKHPLYWIPGETGWSEFTLAGPVTLDPQGPVVHLSYYEADAFARWAGARLPGEAEWESMTAGLAVAGNFMDSGRLHPLPAQEPGLTQAFGDVWEWTRSAYTPYPGFRPAPGAVGEYNGKFMVNQYVLRGGSCATPPGHIRASYRNFFPAGAQWQFAGLRLARDAG